MVQPDCPRPACYSRIVGTTVAIPESEKGGRITGTRLGGEQSDQRYRWAKSCAVLADLMLVCAAPRGEVAAHGITVTPANPTITVGQTQQFTASGNRRPHRPGRRRVAYMYATARRDGAVLGAEQLRAARQRGRQLARPDGRRRGQK